jgi:putative modified peptide
MGEADLTRLAELVKTDPAFRSQFNDDPVAAASSVGMDLSHGEFDQLTDELADDPGVTAEWPGD